MYAYFSFYICSSYHVKELMLYKFHFITEFQMNATILRNEKRYIKLKLEESSSLHQDGNRQRCKCSNPKHSNRESHNSEDLPRLFLHASIKAVIECCVNIKHQTQQPWSYKYISMLWNRVPFLFIFFFQQKKLSIHLFSKR